MTTTGRDGVARDAFDLIVVGAGVFGLGTALEAARRGLDVAIVDGSPLPNPRAASSGPSRKVRSTYLDVAYSRLALDAMAEWERIERDTDGSFFLRLGNLVYTAADSHPTMDAFEASTLAAGGYVERIDGPELHARFPHFRRARVGLFEPGGGLLRATVATMAVATLARRAGVKVLDGVPATRLDNEADRPAVALADGRVLRADGLVVAAGAWTPGLIPALEGSFTLKRQGIAYLPDLPERFDAEGFPPFSELETIFYGFPRIGSDPMRIGWHAYGEVVTDPDVDRDHATEPFLDGVIDFLRDHLGVEVPRAAIIGASCLYDLTPTSDFLIDFLPGSRTVLVVSGGSGHGFKFGSTIGRIAMDRMDGTAGSWLPDFAWERATREPAAR